jgi:hypothetical protein
LNPEEIAKLFRNASLDAYLTDERPPAGSDKTRMVAYPEFERAIQYAYDRGVAHGDSVARAGLRAKLYSELRVILGG